MREASSRWPKLAAALQAVGAGAAERDAEPRWPKEAFDELRVAGVCSATLPDRAGRRVPFGEELALVRAVAGADGSVGRIFDGHLNGVERVAVSAPEPLRSEELDAVARGKRLIGVWGANPLPGEGRPARLVERSAGPVVSGVKVFCSGAGGVERALVTVAGREPGPPLLAYVDCTSGVKVDTTWYRSAGMRASESHRVEFQDAPAAAVLGAPGELVREPYFGRDAIRTAASWAGVADAAAGDVLRMLGFKEPLDDAAALAGGRVTTALLSIDHWLEAAGRRVAAAPEEPLTAFSVQLRTAVADACRIILDEGARAVGARPFATGGVLDRARRDLEVFLLQHRIEPMLARVGRAAIEERR